MREPHARRSLGLASNINPKQRLINIQIGHCVVASLPLAFKRPDTVLETPRRASAQLLKDRSEP